MPRVFLFGDELPTSRPKQPVISCICFHNYFSLHSKCSGNGSYYLDDDSRLCNNPFFANCLLGTVPDLVIQRRDTVSAHTGKVDVHTVMMKT